MPRMVFVYAALLFVTAIYGANYTIAKYVVPLFLIPIAFVSARVSVSTLLFWTFASSRVTEKVTRQDHWLLFKCALFGTALNQFLFFKGLSLTTPIHASLIMTMTPIAVILVAAVLGREKLTSLKIIGTFIGFVGVILLLTKDGVSLKEGTFTGDFFILLNGSVYAIYLVLVKPLMLKYHHFTVLKWIFLYGSVLILPFGIYDLYMADWQNFPPFVWASLVYVILGTTFLVYLLNAWALRYVDASVVGIFIYLQPVFATLVALSLGEDRLDLQTVLYALVIMGGVFLVSKK
jgi:drug/metabolite transporter (DMT)-like permease